MNFSRLSLVSLTLSGLIMGSAALAKTACATKNARFKIQVLMPQNPQFMDQAPKEWQDKLKNLLQECEKRGLKIQEKDKKLEAMVEDAKKKGKFSADSAQEQLREQMINLKNEIDTAQQALQAYFMQQAKKIEADFLEKISTITEAIGKAQGWDSVEPIMIPAYVDAACDVTSDIKTALDAMYTAKAPAKPATDKPAAAPRA